jgi:hypothetical protein
MTGNWSKMQSFFESGNEPSVSIKQEIFDHLSDYYILNNVSAP